MLFAVVSYSQLKIGQRETYSMSRFIFYLAMTVNILAIIMILFVMIMEANRGIEVIIMMVALLPPITAIIAIFSVPDLEERKLRKAVNKAQLKKELEKLES